MTKKIQTHEFYKALILISLENVLNYNIEDIYDPQYISPPRPDALDFIKTLSQNYKLIIFTSHKVIQAKKWLTQYGFSPYISRVTKTKIAAWIFIDNSCIKYDGIYKKILKIINNYSPYVNKDLN